MNTVTAGTEKMKISSEQLKLMAFGSKQMKKNNGPTDSMKVTEKQDVTYLYFLKNKKTHNNNTK